MEEDNRGKWHQRLPKIRLNSRIFSKRMRKVESVTTRHAKKFIIKRWSNVRDVQMSVIVWIVAMGLLIAATGLQLMWYQQSYRTNAATVDGTYAEAVLGPVDTLNPLFASSSAEKSASYLMFSSLLRYDITGHLNNDLATSVKIDDTKTVYSVTIRPDAKWHDGNKLTTNDIAFTIDLMKNPNVRSVISGWKDITVKVVDETTIQFSLKAIYAAFEHALTFPVLPEHILKDVAASVIRENDFSQNPVGSGPFKFNFIQSIETNSARKVIHMGINDNYYGGTAKLARFQLHAYNTVDAIINALSMNEVNAAADLSPLDLNRIDSKKYVFSSKPIKAGVYAILNTKGAILNDASLRRALQMATNTQVVRDNLSDATSILDLPFTSNQLTGNLPAVSAFNQAGAIKILDDNGWVLNPQSIREKAGKQLKLTVVTMKDSQLELALEAICGQWRDLGIIIETKVVDPNDVMQNVVQTVLQPRNYDVLLYQLDIGADPDVYAYWHSSQISEQGSNFSNYSNIISDDALLSARSRIEPDLRNAKYITFAKQWLADVPAIGLYQSNALYIRSNNVRSSDDSTILISPIDRYSDVLNWSVGSRSVYKTP